MNIKLSTFNCQLSIIQLFSYSVILLAALFFALPAKAQVEIGDNANPQAYSLMEVATSHIKGGLRLPQLKITERDSLNALLLANPAAAQGLVIFNVETFCVEYWSVDHWVNLCNNGAEIFFTNPNADPSVQANRVDPTAVTFPSGGSTIGPFVSHGTPECTSTDPAYTLTVKLGAATIASDPVATGAFTIAMTPNTSLGARFAIINVKDNCTNQSKDFLFTQAGKCISPPDRPGKIKGDTVVGVNSTGYQNAGLTYKVDKVEGVSHTWLLPEGWTRIDTDPVNCDSITVNVGSTRGTGTITVIPSNDCGNGAPSTLTVKISCGAYITGSAGSPEWKEFMCWNLGADYAADPLVPSQSLHGAKYKWGLATPALSVADDQNQSNNAGFATWTTAYGIPPTTSGDWDMTTANPCPAGFRLPSSSEMSNLQANNGVSGVAGLETGTGGIYLNYTAGIYIGNSLFLPAAGARDAVMGAMNQNRGAYGFYWTSTSSSNTSGDRVYFYLPGATISQSGYGRSFGYSVRCVAQ